MRILRYILTIFVVLTALTACHNDDSPANIGKGKGRVVLGGVDIEVDATTRTYSIPTPSINDLTIEIIDQDNFVIESGHIDHYVNGIDLFVATYTLRAYYGNRQQMGNSPYFEGTATFSILKEETTNLGTVIVTLANAIINPNIPTDVIDHFTGVPKFYVSYDEQREEVTNGQSLYVLPGKYTLYIEGTNKAGIEVKKTITELDAVAQKVYNINCNLTLPTLTLPEQQNGAWAKRLYITPAIATDKTGQIEVPKGVIYEAVPINDDWNTPFISERDVDNNIVIKGLTANTQYKVRARLIDVTTSNIEIIETEKEESDIPNKNLNDYCVTAGKDGKYNDRGAVYQFWASNSSSWWSTNNETTCPDCGLYNRSHSSRSGTRPTTVDSRNAAQIMTIGYGKNNKIAIPDAPKYKAIGFLNIDKHKFYTRPSKLRFFYKYIPYNNDEPEISIKIYDNSNQSIGEGKLEAPYQSLYTETFLNIKYAQTQTKAAYIEIKFMSGSKHTDVYKREEAGMDDAMPAFIGSQLFIDDIELIYE